MKVNRNPQLKSVIVLVVTDTGCRKYPKNIRKYIIYVHIVISYPYLTLTNTQITLLQLPFCWRLEHPHIVKMYECFEERQSLWLVSGTLRDGSGSSRAESGEYLWSWCMIVETFAFWVNCSTEMAKTLEWRMGILQKHAKTASIWIDDVMLQLFSKRDMNF